MANQHHVYCKPSDFPVFAYKVWESSATYMDFDQYFDVYVEVLRLMFYNPEVDNQIAIRELREKNDSGVVLGIQEGFNHG